MRVTMRMYILLICVIFLTQLPLATQAKELSYDRNDVMVHSVHLPGGVKQGLLLISNGLWIAPPKYNWIYDFGFDNTAFIEVNHKWGIIDANGRELISPRFEGVEGFSEGLAAVKQSGKFGFVDKSDKLVIAAQYDYVGYFTEGFCPVNADGKWGYIDKTGNIIIALQYDEAGGFSQGLAAVRVDNKWGFIDLTGKMIVNPEYDKVYPFTEGLAAVQKDDRWGYINLKGEIVIPLQYHGHFGGWSFTEGLAAVHFNGSYGHINGKFGFIDKAGIEAITPQYDIAIPFHEGRALVEVNNKWGFIDKTGKYIIEPVLDKFAQRPAMFIDGYAVVGYQHKFGVIDKNGEWVVKPTNEGFLKYYHKYKIIEWTDFNITKPMDERESYDIFTRNYLTDIDGKQIDHYINHIRDGYKYIKAKSPTLAIMMFKKALRINPEDEAALYGIKQAEQLRENLN